MVAKRWSPAFCWSRALIDWLKLQYALAPTFLRHRNDNGEYLFCKQDTHWSGRACALTAKIVADEIRNRPYLKDVLKRQFETEKQNVQITGDLWTALGNGDLPKETLPLTFAKERTANGLVSVLPWRESPVLLVGDSHNLIFHAGEDMQAQGAGLADHLAAELGFPVDVVGVRSSGATPSRLNLFGGSIAWQTIYCWITGTFLQPWPSVNSLTLKHQMTTFLPSRLSLRLTVTYRTTCFGEGVVACSKDRNEDVCL